MALTPELLVIHYYYIMESEPDIKMKIKVEIELEIPDCGPIEDWQLRDII